jgi:radical SAM protein with 4Fe4S-binding SPASM domain
LYYNVFKKSDSAREGFSWKLHPLAAYLFSFFDGSRNLQETIDLIAAETDMDIESITKAITPFIENSESMFFPLFNDDKVAGAMVLPQNLLIQKKDDHKIRNLLKGINVEEILENLDFSLMRFKIPNDITIMVNNDCVTNCVYCYADKSHVVKNHLSFERIVELIDEAKKLQMRTVEISGGELFLYKHWYELLKKLHECEYQPFISTKTPIDENTILKLKELGVGSIQISLDTVDNDKMMRMINVDSKYLDRMKSTLNNLEKHDIKVQIKSVVTHINDSVENAKDLLDFISKHKNIFQISFAPGEHSLYRPFTYATTQLKVQSITDYINKHQTDYPGLKIVAQGSMGSTFNLPFEERKKIFEQRSLCSGNLTNYFILPDGKVTICEQMYWHPFFILGDVTNQSLMDVWNSKKALSLWNIKQHEIRPESACHTCPDFEKCRRGKGTCWRNAIQAYGHDNYDYPSTNCPYSPLEKIKMFID